MNPTLSGIMLGKALAEGDALGAIPFLTDLVAAVKQAAPGVIQKATSKEVAKLKSKYLGTPAAPAIVETTTSAAPSAPARPAWILPVSVGLGGLFLFLFLKKRGRK